MTAIISLGVSAVLMAVLIMLKRFELRAGHRYFSGLRDKLDRTAIRLWHFSSSTLPRILLRLARYVVICSIDLLSSGLLRFVRLMEGKLNRFVVMVKGKKELNRKGSSSAYLQDVASHKEEVRRNFQNENNTPE